VNLCWLYRAWDVEAGAFLFLDVISKELDQTTRLKQDYSAKTEK